jgi:hypothetical protein
LAAGLASLALSWCAGASAQSQLQLAQSETPSMAAAEAIQPEEREVESTVRAIRNVEVTSPNEVRTVLRLDNDTDLVVPELTVAPGADVKVGARISADYVNEGNRKVATFLRTPELIQAP